MRRRLQLVAYLAEILANPSAWLLAWTGWALLFPVALQKYAALHADQFLPRGVSLRHPRFASELWLLVQGYAGQQARPARTMEWGRMAGVLLDAPARTARLWHPIPVLWTLPGEAGLRAAATLRDE